MKKLVSLATAAALLASLILPAAAAEADADARLKSVTGKVKETLSLNTEKYKQFDGSLVENTLSPVWHLSWGGDGDSLDITAGEDGRIISYYLWDDNDKDRNSQDLRLPTIGLDTAKKSAQTFVDKVLKKGVETVSFNADNIPQGLQQTSYRFDGNILLNGVQSPLSVNLEVRSSDNLVTRFSRDDLASQYFGTLPSPAAKTSKDQAQKKLTEKLSLRLEYVLNEDGTTASLQYLPNSRPDYYVDAHTGQLVNVSDLMKNLTREQSSLTEDAGAGKNALTDAEQSGVDKLAGVLSRETLDSKIRSMSELALSGYTLSRVSYYTVNHDASSKSDPSVSVNLVYGKKDSSSNVWQKYVTVDGRSGTLQSLWSSIPWNEKNARTTDQSASKTKSSAFLSKYFGENFSQYDTYELDSVANPYRISQYVAEDSVTYARKVNGYFLPSDRYTVSVSKQDGSITAFDYQPSADNVKFDSADGVVDMSAALSTWRASFDTTLSYVAVPLTLDLSNPGYKPLIDAGHTWIYTLQLGWQLHADSTALGVDAKTGKIIHTEQTAPKSVTYSDLGNHWSKTIVQRLAQYGVGFDGGIFAPQEPLRQKDLIALMLSMRGTRFDPAQLEGDTVDELYNNAYWNGLIDKAERNDNKLVPRAEVVKLLLDSAGYRSAAALQGIYTCNYTDAAKIPSAFYSYAALAQGVGLVKSQGAAFDAGRTATRAEAAVMIYNLLNR